jgi:hypothetical protein
MDGVEIYQPRDFDFGEASMNANGVVCVHRDGSVCA